MDFSHFFFIQFRFIFAFFVTANSGSNMSIRTNPMKAVAVLLKSVEMARRKFMESGRDESFDGKLEKLRGELKKIEDVFMRVKNNQDALLDTLHDVHSHLRNLDSKRLDQDMDHFCKRIRDCAHNLLPIDSFDSEPSDDPPSSQQQYNTHLLPPQPPPLNPEDLQIVMRDFKLRYCLSYLSIFPVNAVIKKRQAIFLWSGIWCALEEEAYEKLIDRLLGLNVIVAYSNDKCPIVNKFKLNPHIRPHLESIVQREKAEGRGYYLRTKELNETSLVLAQQKVTLGHEVQSTDFVFNVGASYLNFGSQWFDKGRTSRLNMLYLGRWQDSPSHHIEVGSQDFLKYSRNLENLMYLSLRGISRVFELPPFIAQLHRLKILDLKACHNLETLPDDISSMKNLTHLILSQCYLLDGMPRGIDKLTQLQVLKGFVLGSSRNTPCTISDLANLENLRRLSIHIRKEAVIKDMKFGSLRKMSRLEHLKISWGVSDTRYSDIQMILPSRLKKLHVEGFPGQVIPEWLKRSQLPLGFKELNITGGKLASMNHFGDMNHLGVEIVRLKYLKHLEIDLTTLQEFFPRLRYALIKQIPYGSYVEWSKG